ncbi:MAG: MFS transporter [Eubacteriales bacterium]
MDMAQTNNKLQARKKMGYAISETANNFHAHIDMFFLLYFLTDVFGMTGGAVAALLLVVRLWDAINDPIMGYVSDHTRSRWGSFRPYLLFMALPFAVLKVLQYTTPAFSMAGKTVYMYVIYILYSMVMTSIFVPYTAMLPSLTKNYRERSSIASLKTVVGMLGTLIVAVLFQPIVGLFPDEKTGFQMAALIFVVIATIFYWITFASTREQTNIGKKEKYPIKKMYQMLLGNKPLLILCISNVFSTMVNVVMAQTLVYYFKYNVGNEGLYPIAMMVVMLSLVGGSMIVPLVASKLGKRNTFIAGNLVSIIGGILILFTPSANVILFMVSCGLLAIGVAPTLVLVYSMAADCVEYGHWKHNIRAEGLTFSFLGFSTKLSSAIGGAIGGIIFAITGYIPNVLQTPSALFGIKAQLSIVPIVLAMISMTIIRFYRIDGKLYKDIIDDLEQRNITE